MEIQRYNIFMSTDQANSAPPSSNGIYPANNSLTFILDKPPLILTRPENYFTVELTNICMPFSFNQVNQANNLVVGNFFDINGVITNFDLLVPVGSYDIDQFCGLLTTLIQNIYQSINPGGTAVVGISVFDYNQGKCIVSLTIGTETTLQLFLNFGYSPLSLGNEYIGSMIGMRIPITIFQPLGLPSYSNAFYNVNPINQIVLRSSALNGFNFQFMGSSTPTGFGACEQSTVIACFNILTTPGSYLNSTNLIPIKTRIKSNSINAIDLTFFPDDNTQYPLDFNGGVSFFSLVIIEYSPVIVNDFPSMLNYLLKSLSEMNDKTNKTITDIQHVKEVHQDTHEVKGSIPPDGSRSSLMGSASIEEAKISSTPETIRENLEKALLDLKKF